MDVRVVSKLLHVGLYYTEENNFTILAEVDGSPKYALAASKGSNNLIMVYITNGQTINSTSNGELASLAYWPDDDSILTCAITDTGLPNKEVRDRIRGKLECIGPV